MIDSSCLWSLELYHNNEVDVDERWVDFMLTTKRKFGTIKLNMILDIPKNKTLEIFQKHGYNVTTLHLIGSCIDSFIRFAEVLKCMPNLRHVIVLETSTLCGVSDTPPDQDLPDLKKLKTLEMIGSEYSIVNCFQKAKLTTIKVLNSYHEHSLDCEPLEDFLKTQDMLTTLAFRSIHHTTSMLFRTDHLNVPMPFHLTRLSLLNVQLQESPNDYNNLLKFLKPQTKTLQELELGHRFPSFVFEFIFANMTKLRTLSLMMSELPQEKEFYERLEENRSVENLIFLESGASDGLGNQREKFICDFLNKLPNVCSLNIQEYCGRGTFMAIAKSLSKLQSLTTQFCKDGFTGVHFPNLKALHIHRMNEKIDWNAFTKAHSRLTELTIEVLYDEEMVSMDDMENIANNVSLETLRLDEFFTAGKRFFEIIGKNCTNLKVLDLHKSSVSFLQLADYKDCHLLRLCENDVIKCSKYFTLWNEGCYDGRLQNYFDEENDDWDGGPGVLDPFDLHNLIDFDSDDNDPDDDYDQWDDGHGYDYGINHEFEE